MTISDQELDRRLAALTRTSDAPKSLWHKIEPRLSRRRWPSLAAAGFGIAAMLVAALVLIEPSEPDSAPAFHLMVSAEVEAMRRQAPAAPWPLPTSGNGLSAAWEENLAAITELEQALKRNPGNTLLLEFLVRARLRQSELIHLATTLAPAGPDLST